MTHTWPARSEHRFLALLGALAGLWLVFAVGLVPWLIRSAYAETSLPILNGLLEGRNIHPVEHYLGLWWGLVRTTLIGLLLVAGLGYVGIRHWRPIKAAFVGRAWAKATLGPALLVAAWLGWWTGLIDVSYRMLEVAVNQAPHGLGVEDLWLAPVLGATVTGGLGCLAWTIAGRVQGGATLHPVVTVGVGLLFYSWLRLLGLGIHPLASIVLAFGLASQLSRPLVTWGRGFAAVARRTFPWMVVATVVTALSIATSESLFERRTLRGLQSARAGAANVLLVILDTARAANMSLYGSERSTTPHLDRLAERGTVFDRAIAPTPWTLPSIATYVTGLWPQEHRASWRVRLSPEHRTLAEVLSEQGYATGGFVANWVFTTRSTGLDQGFQRYRDDSLTFARFIGSLEFVANPVTRVRGWLGNHTRIVRRDAEEVNDEFLDWLDGSVEDERPFFALINYMDLHSEYEPHSPFDTLFSPPGDRYWIGPEWTRASRFSQGELDELETAYDEAMAYLDSQIGALLDQLERRGRLDNTLVVIAGDHGEQFGEHDLLAHSNSLYMPLLRVPMLVVDPDGDAPAGARIDTRVSLQRLPATILDLLRVPPELPGESLAKFWREGDSEEPILTQLDRGFVQGEMRGVLDREWNYIRNLENGGDEELYNLADDPNELENLALRESDGEVAARIMRMRVLLDSISAGDRVEGGGGGESR